MKDYIVILYVQDFGCINGTVKCKSVKEAVKPEVWYEAITGLKYDEENVYGNNICGEHECICAFPADCEYKITEVDF